MTWINNCRGKVWGGGLGLRIQIAACVAAATRGFTQGRLFLTRITRSTTSIAVPAGSS